MKNSLIIFKKIFISFLTVVLIYNFTSLVPVNAVTDSGAGSSVVTSTRKINPDDFGPVDIEPSDEEEVAKMASVIVAAIQAAGIIVAFLGILLLGVKYLFGSVEQKADYKKTMIPYLIGCVMIFCITTIVRIIYQLVPNNV